MIAGAELQNGDDVSIFTFGTMVLRNRWRIARWMLIGAVLAGLSVATKPKLYKSSASFMPQGTDPNRTMLSGLAGQLGVSVPAAATTNSSDFYSKLLRSPALLREIARDTFVIVEGGRRALPFVELFDIPPGNPPYREQLAVRQLQSMVQTSVDKTTGIVEFSLATRWPEVSQAIATSLLNGVNEFNQRSRQAQAAAERHFLQGRLDIANAELRRAEDRLQRFLSANRMIASPQLSFERERLEREVEMRQQVVLALTESYEDAQLREVRNTPLITPIEPPTAPAWAEPRGRVMRVLLGVIAGGLVGVLLSFLAFVAARRRHQGSPEIDEFFSTLGSIKGGLIRRLPWSGKKTAVRSLSQTHTK